MNEYSVKAADYRAKAASELLVGAAATLDHVRAKHDRAARVWTELAEAEDARAAQKIRRDGLAADRLQAASAADA